MDIFHSDSDDELIALGDRLRSSWAAEVEFVRVADMDDPASTKSFEALCAATSAIISDIEKAPIHTVAGLQVKALAVSWCHAGVEIDLGTLTRDMRISNQVMNHLANMKKAGR